MSEQRRFTERFGRVRIVGHARPDADDRTIFMNAPRPITGTRYLSDPARPQPYAVEGLFVVAIDPTDPDAARHIAANRSLDACVLVFVPPVLLEQIGAASYVVYARSDWQTGALVQEIAGRMDPSNLLASKGRNVLEKALNPKDGDA